MISLSPSGLLGWVHQLSVIALYGGSAWLTAAKQISDVLVADILEAVHPA
jgi:hypothetical protein